MVIAAPFRGERRANTPSRSTSFQEFQTREAEFAERRRRGSGRAGLADCAGVATRAVWASWADRGGLVVAQSLVKALEEVTATSGLKSKFGSFARSLRPLLEAAVRELGASSVTRASRRGTGEIEYVVERTEQ